LLVVPLTTKLERAGSVLAEVAGVTALHGEAFCPAAAGPGRDLCSELLAAQNGLVR
jgi:hypothetical protein